MGAKSMHNKVQTPLRISSSCVKLLPRSDKPTSKTVDNTIISKKKMVFGDVIRKLSLSIVIPSIQDT